MSRRSLNATNVSVLDVPKRHDDASDEDEAGELEDPLLFFGLTQRQVSAREALWLRCRPTPSQTTRSGRFPTPYPSSLPPLPLAATRAPWQLKQPYPWHPKPDQRGHTGSEAANASAVANASEAANASKTAPWSEMGSEFDTDPVLNLQDLSKGSDGAYGEEGEEDGASEADTREPALRISKLSVAWNSYTAPVFDLTLHNPEVPWSTQLEPSPRRATILHGRRPAPP